MKTANFPFTANCPLGMVVVLTFNPSTWARRVRQIFEFKANLVYKVSSRISRDDTENPVWEGKRKIEEKKNYLKIPDKKTNTNYDVSFYKVSLYSTSCPGTSSVCRPG